VRKNTVLQHLARRGAPDRPYRKVHGATLQRAIVLYQSGASLRLVATELHVTRGALTDAFRLAGVPVRAK
jgi:hypothetical protein